MQPNSMAHFVCDLMLHTPPRLSNIPDLPISFGFCKLSLKKKICFGYILPSRLVAQRKSRIVFK